MCGFVSTRSDPPPVAPSRAETLLSLSGPVGTGEIAGLQRRIAAALDGEPHDLVIDLRGVWAFSPEAVSVLVGAASRQHAHEQHLTLIYAAGSPIDTALKSATRGSDSFTTVWAIPDWGPVRRAVRATGRDDADVRPGRAASLRVVPLPAPRPGRPPRQRSDDPR